MRTGGSVRGSMRGDTVGRVLRHSKKKGLGHSHAHQTHIVVHLNKRRKKKKTSQFVNKNRFKWIINSEERRAIVTITIIYICRCCCSALSKKRAFFFTAARIAAASHLQHALVSCLRQRCTRVDSSWARRQSGRERGGGRGNTLHIAYVQNRAYSSRSLPYKADREMVSSTSNRLVTHSPRHSEDSLGVVLM